MSFEFLAFFFVHQVEAQVCQAWTWEPKAWRARVETGQAGLGFFLLQVGHAGFGNSWRQVCHAGFVWLEESVCRSQPGECLGVAWPICLILCYSISIHAWLVHARTPNATSQRVAPGSAGFSSLLSTGWSEPGCANCIVARAVSRQKVMFGIRVL